MNILIPILAFSRAGGYRVLSQLANHWIAKGHHVDFLVHHGSEEPYFPTSAGIYYTNSLGRLSELGHANIKYSKWFIAIRRLLSLYKGLSVIGKNYDIILANQSLTAWPVAFADCGQAKKYYYIQAYEPESMSLMPGVKAFIAKILSIYSYKLDIIRICNSPIYLRYREIRAIDWVPPGIDRSIFSPIKNRKNLFSATEIVIGCIGRSEPEKGITYVLDAFKKISMNDQRICLKVAYGNLPDNFHHPRVEIITPKNDYELSLFYKSLDIMIAPATRQLGAVHYPVLESMSCGIPLITTGYLPASEHNSWIVPIENSDAIVEKILEIISSPFDVVESKVAIAEQATNDFLWEVVSEKFLKIFSAKFI